jgi:sulfate/thiosulfate transport system substrate-binding protein
MKRLVSFLAAACALLVLLAGCGASANGSTVTLTLGAFSTPSAVYAKLIPLFEAQWKQQTGQTVTFHQSYQASGTQSKAIINGFQADVAALSLAPDIDAIAKAGLITHDWTATPTGGMVSDSIVAFAVRQGNPKGIHDWADLARPGIQILTPNPQTSGGAQWNILALYGAALRGEVSGVPKGDATAAFAFLKAVLKNVKVMDKDAQTSITDFEQGVGDVAITYESSVLTGQKAGNSEQLVIPTSTILIQNPVAVVDRYVDQHGTRTAAEGFVNFLITPQAQQIYAQVGQMRPVDASVAQSFSSQFASVTDLWKIDFLGGWKAVKSQFFGPNGIYTQAITQVQGG